MPAISTKRPSRRDHPTLRIVPDDRGRIDRAAELAGKTRTDFVLDAARRAAVETITERTLFSVDAATYAKFLAALAAPPPSPIPSSCAPCKRRPPGITLDRCCTLFAR